MPLRSQAPGRAPKLAGLAAALLAATTVTALAAPRLGGTWVEIGPRTTFHFEPCGQGDCATLVDSIYIKADADARDVKNPDPSLRDRRLKGLTILKHLMRQGENWSGEIYIPSMGKTFPVTLSPVDARTLHMTVCLSAGDCHTVTLVES